MHKILFLILIVSIFSCSTKKAVVKQPIIHLSAKQISEIETSLVEFKRLMLYDKSDEAIAVLDKVFAIDSTNSVAFYEKAKVYFQNKNYDDALSNIQLALISDSKKEIYRLFEIAVLKSLNDINAVSNAYTSLLEDFSTKEEYWFEAMDFYLSSKQFEKALEVLEYYESIFGYSDAIAINKFKLYLQLGKGSKLEKILINYHTQFPTNTIVLQLLGDYYLHKRDVSKAIDYYKQVLAYDSESYEALLALADYYHRSGDLKQSFHYIEQVINLQQVAVENKITILLQFMDIAKEDPQFNYYFKSITVNLRQQYPSNPDVQLLYGNILGGERKYEEAQKEFETALTERPDNLQAWIQLIMIDNELKNNDKIIEHSSAAIEYFPNQLELYYYRGLAFYLKEDFENALKDFAFGNKITGKNDPLKFHFLYFIGESYYNLKNHVEAFSYFDKALEINPNETSLLNNYAYYLSVLGLELEKAKEMSLKSIKEEPNSSTFLDTYAWILFRMKDYSNALIYIERAILNGGSSSSVVMEHYGDILYKLGKTDEAITVWKEALDLPDSTESLKIKNETKTYFE